MSRVFSAPSLLGIGLVVLARPDHIALTTFTLMFFGAWFCGFAIGRPAKS